MTADPKYLVDTNSFITVAQTTANAAVKAGATDGGVAAATAALQAVFGNGSYLIITDAVRYEMRQGNSADATAIVDWLNNNASTIKIQSTNIGAANPNGGTDIGEQSILEVAADRIAMGYTPNIVSEEDSYFATLKAGTALDNAYIASNVLYTPEFMNVQLANGVLTANNYAPIRDDIMDSTRYVGQSVTDGVAYYQDFKDNAELKVVAETDPNTGLTVYGEANATPVTLTEPTIPAGMTATAAENQAIATVANTLQNAPGIPAAETTGTGLLSAENLEGVGKVLGIVGLVTTVLDFGSDGASCRTGCCCRQLSRRCQSLQQLCGADHPCPQRRDGWRHRRGRDLLLRPFWAFPYVERSAALWAASAAARSTRPAPTRSIRSESAFGTLFDDLASSVLSLIPTASTTGVTTKTVGSTAVTLTDPNAAYLLNSSTGALTSVDQSGVANTGSLNIVDANGNYWGGLAESNVTGILDTNSNLQINAKMATALAALTFNTKADSWSYSVDGTAQTVASGSSNLSVANNSNGSFSVDDVATGASPNVQSVLNNFTSSGSLTQQTVDNTNNTSNVTNYNPTTSILSLMNDYTGLNGAGVCTSSRAG